MEREWREASDMRRSVAGLGAVLAIAAGLRFWALGHGVPFVVGVDEPQIMTRVIRMMTTGDFNPHFYDYPGLYLYAQLVLACMRFLFGVVNGTWGSLQQVSAGDFYVWGRALTALLGTATVYLVYVIGSRWGARHALLAAGLMAVMPNHVRESHYVLTDVPMAFLVTLSFLLTLRALEKRTLGAFAWAGAVAGLAGATKYYGGLVVVAPAAAALMARGMDRPRTTVLLSVIGATVAGFLAGAPYSVLDLPGFLNGFASLNSAFHGKALAEPAWLTYMKHLRLAIWWPGLLLLLWGTIHAIVRAITGPGKERFSLLVLFPALYAAFLGTRTFVFARYMMPLFPFISLLVAIAIVSGVTLLRRFNIPRAARTALIVALTVVAILPPLVGAVSFDRMISRPSTGQLAYEWITKNAAPGSRVVVEAYGFDMSSTEWRVTPIGRLIDKDGTLCSSGQADYAIASEDVFGRYLLSPGVYPGESAAYATLFRGMELLATITKSPTVTGAELRIYRCPRPRPDVRKPATDGVEAVQKLNEARPGGR